MKIKFESFCLICLKYSFGKISSQTSLSSFPAFCSCLGSPTAVATGKREPLLLLLLLIHNERRSSQATQHIQDSFLVSHYSLLFLILAGFALSMWTQRKQRKSAVKDRQLILPTSRDTCPHLIHPQWSPLQHVTLQSIGTCLTQTESKSHPYHPVCIFTLVMPQLSRSYSH